MKKTISFVLTSLLAVTAFSQTVNDVPIADIDAEYIQLIAGKWPLLSSKTTVNIDFGQPAQLLSNKHTVIKDKDGKKVIFNSMIEALNFMTKNGYEFVQAYVMQEGDNSYCHYLMRRKNKNPKAGGELSIEKHQLRPNLSDSSSAIGRK